MSQTGMECHGLSSAVTSCRDIRKGIVMGATVLAIVTAAGAAFIVGIGVGILLVFHKIQWLIRWGLVD